MSCYVALFMWHINEYFTKSSILGKIQAVNKTKKARPMFLGHCASVPCTRGVNTTEVCGTSASSL